MPLLRLLLVLLLLVLMIFLVFACSPVEDISWCIVVDVDVAVLSSPVIFKHNIICHRIGGCERKCCLLFSIQNQFNLYSNL